MNARDNIQAELQRMSMEIVRLTNEKASQEEYVRFLESENRTIEEETRRECLQQVELANLERDNALKRAVEAEDGRKKSDAKAANLQLLLDEITLALSESNKKVTILTEKVKSIDDLKDVLEGNPIMPSFARFYLESKFGYNLSENRILEMLKGMKTSIPQSSLNLWMHQIMELLREKLEPLMLAAIRQSKFTNNDATRLLVRSRESLEDPLK